MLGFMNKLMGKDKSYREQYEQQMKKQQKVYDSVIKDKVKRVEMQGKCKAVLEECKLNFQATINNERARAMKMRQEGFDTSVEESRIRECAVGILVCNEAKFKLQSISSESDLNMTMNRLGMALRQMRRMDNSGSAISASTRNILEEWCPGVLAQLGNGTDTQFEIPEALRSRIDNNMLADVLNGDDFDMAMYKASKRAQMSGSQNGDNTAKLDKDIQNARDIVQKYSNATKKEDVPNVSDLMDKF